MPCTKSSGAETTTVPALQHVTWKFTASKKNPASILRILSEASADGACLVKVTGNKASGYHGCWLFGNAMLVSDRLAIQQIANWRQYPLKDWEELKKLVQDKRHLFKRPAMHYFEPQEQTVESVAIKLRKWTPKPGDFFRVPDNPKQQISKRDRRRGVTKPSEAAQPFKCTSITVYGVNAIAADGTQGFLPYSCTFEPTLMNVPDSEIQFAKQEPPKYNFDPNALSTHKTVKPASRIVWPSVPKKTFKVVHPTLMKPAPALIMGDSHAHEAPNLQLQTYAKTRPHPLQFNAAEAEARVFAHSMHPLLNKKFPPPTTPLTNNPLDRLVNETTPATPRGRHDATAELVSTAAAVPAAIQSFTIVREDGTTETWQCAEHK